MSQKPQNTGGEERIASRDEVLSAWKALSKEDEKRLLGYAAVQLRMRQLSAKHLAEKDLLREACKRVLGLERKWRLGHEPFVKFMFGTIRSIARDLRRTNAGKLDARTTSLDLL